ncbi:hypothetical protein IMZ48_46790, partial [Candidatus Bathyarchaeota archaeon]|nr:hypothetical protein [Candidatus Bathyarchaeota archaeon]
ELSDFADYEEELFPKSEDTSDWCSDPLHTPSVSSMLDSSLGGSMQSLAPSRPPLRPSRPFRQQPTMPSSLPISMAKPKNLSAAPFDFSHDQGVFSKSWSDLWEEEEEEEVEHARQLQSLKEINSRTWSHESIKTMGARDGGMADKENHPHPDIAHGDVDDDFLADGFFFQEAPAPGRASAPRYSPPPKRGGFDKWAALGERRRGQLNGERESGLSPKAHREYGLGQAAIGEISSWDHYHQNDYKTVRGEKERERAKGCPRNIGRDCNRRPDKRIGLGDVEWVGAWPEVHT